MVKGLRPEVSRMSPSSERISTPRRVAFCALVLMATGSASTRWSGLSVSVVAHAIELLNCIWTPNWFINGHSQSSLFQGNPPGTEVRPLGLTKSRLALQRDELAHGESIAEIPSNQTCGGDLCRLHIGPAGNQLQILPGHIGATDKCKLMRFIAALGGQLLEPGQFNIQIFEPPLRNPAQTCPRTPAPWHSHQPLLQ